MNIMNAIFKVAVSKKAKSNPTSENGKTLKEICSEGITYPEFLEVLPLLDEQTTVSWIPAMMAACTGFVINVERKYEKHIEMLGEEKSDYIPTFTDLGRLVFGEHVEDFTRGDVEDVGVSCIELGELKTALDDIYIQLQQFYMINEQLLFGWKDNRQVLGLAWSFTITDSKEYIEHYSYEEAYQAAIKRAEDYRIKQSEQARKAKSAVLAKIKAMRNKAA